MFGATALESTLRPFNDISNLPFLYRNPVSTLTTLLIYWFAPFVGTRQWQGMFQKSGKSHRIWWRVDSR